MEAWMTMRHINMYAFTTNEKATERKCLGQL